MSLPSRAISRNLKIAFALCDRCVFVQGGKGEVRGNICKYMLKHEKILYLRCVHPLHRHDGIVTWEGFESSQGLRIEETGVYRVNGNLAVARAIGDVDCRPWVSGEHVQLLRLQYSACSTPPSIHLCIESEEIDGNWNTL